MKPIPTTSITAGVFAGLALSAGAANAADVSQDAIDACIDSLRAQSTAAAQGGMVMSTEFSEANSVVMLKDSGGTVWRCLVSNDGSFAELTMADADDGGGAMAGAPAQQDVRVAFAPGTTGATYSEALGSGDAVRYILGAKSGQDLSVELRGNSEFLNYIIYVPSGDILDESSQSGYRYAGQLYESGDHVVEVFYNGNQGTTGSYDIIFEIK